MKDFVALASYNKSVVDQFNDDFDAFDCPCCKRIMHIYKRTLHKSIILQLINLLNAGGNLSYVHSDKFITGTVGKDFAIAKHWELIEREPNPDHKKKTSGKWKLTRLGIEFLNGQTPIYKYSYLYNDELIGTSQSKVYIVDCLGQAFDYSTIKPQFKLFNLFT